MRALKIVLYIIGSVLAIFGFLNILGAGAGVRNGILIGILLFVVAIIFIVVATLLKTPGQEVTNVTLKVDLPGNVNMDTLKCKSCGGTLGPEDVTIVNGAPVVTCPWCHTTYQLTEEPKW
jgi:amino acid transporter